MGHTWGRAALVALLALVLTTAYSESFLRFIFRPHVMEAYVNPTGGMAETLWGYHKTVACPNCGFTFPLNASSEADPQAERHQRITQLVWTGLRYQECEPKRWMRVSKEAHSPKWPGAIEREVMLRSAISCEVRDTIPGLFRPSSKNTLTIGSMPPMVSRMTVASSTLAATTRPLDCGSSTT